MVGSFFRGIGVSWCRVRRNSSMARAFYPKLRTARPDGLGGHFGRGSGLERDHAGEHFVQNDP